MRLIDADALKELFSEVIGSIAKKPEMNGNLEHMIRASAMVIQMIDDAPTIQLGTNLAEVGTDLVSRQQAIDALDKRFDKIPMGQTTEILMLRKDLRELPSIQPETNCSEIPNNWVPCSERLPEDDTEVLVYLFENNKSPYISWLSDGRWYTEYFEVEREDEPVAWMPLPEPYKEGGE